LRLRPLLEFAFTEELAGVISLNFATCLTSSAVLLCISLPTITILRGER
jgi:hypothetical protein